MSPPTSTLSYIFPAKTRGPGGEVMRAASLTQSAAPSAESSWGRGARPPPPPSPDRRPELGGRPSPEVPVQSRPAAPPVAGEQRGSCVWGEEGVPRLPHPGNVRPRPGNSAAPPRGGSRLESHAVRGRVPRLPKCAGQGRDRRGVGGRGARRALPPPRRGSRASPGRGFRVGVGTPRGSASARSGAAGRRWVSEVRAAAPRPEPARPLPGSPTPFPPPRPVQAPPLT